MSDISFDVAEGYHLAPFTAKMVLSGNVQSVQYSVNAAPPSISKYVAYDQLVPPNPFIAVTQDGNGNVVYDGGFPKFYNVSAPIDGINSSITMEFGATCEGGVGNLYYYNAFSDLPVTISIGDKLVYDMFQDSVNARVAIDAITDNIPANNPGQYSLRDWGSPAASTILDQNGLKSHPATNLGNRAFNQWYHREFDLSQCAGQTFVKWSMAYEGEVAGVFKTRFRDVSIVDKNGNVKAFLFKDVIKLPNNTPTESGASGYTALSKTVYDPRNQLTASFKYLYNAIIWVANQKKVAAGNRKILILGDTPPTGSYAIKASTPNGFFTSISRLCAAVGFVPTFKDSADYIGGMVNETLAELEQYSCVLLMGSQSGAVALISDACINALVSFRENGNGIIMVTDHGPIINDIANAYPPVGGSAFFWMVNKLATKFGAYFSGNYDRTPVNVGFLRSTYGDHPLYAGMDNSESIDAGGSESRVQVSTTPSVLPGAVPSFNIQNGQTVINVAVLLTSGEIVPFKITYNVVTFKISFTDGVSTKDNGQVLDVGVKNQASLSAMLLGNVPNNIQGILYKNSSRIASVTYTEAIGLKHVWDSGAMGPISVQDGDSISLVVNTPIAMTSLITIKRFQPNIGGNVNLASMLSVLKGYNPSLPSVKLIKGIIKEISDVVPWLGLKQTASHPINLKLISDFFNNTGLVSKVLPSAATGIYPTGRTFSPSGGYAIWVPTNPVTGQPIDFGYYVFSPLYGSESVPANFNLDYYANLFIPAGTYRMFSHADDVFKFSLDGLARINAGGRGTVDITIAESKFYAVKISNTNIPINTPSWWTCALIDLVTGNNVLSPTPGVFKTEEYSRV